MELDVASCIRDGQYSMFDDGWIDWLLAENGILESQDMARAMDTGRQAPPASQHQPQGPREQRDDGPVASGAFSQRPPEQPPSSQDSNAGFVSLANVFGLLPSSLLPLGDDNGRFGSMGVEPGETQLQSSLPDHAATAPARNVPTSEVLDGSLYHRADMEAAPAPDAPAAPLAPAAPEAAPLAPAPTALDVLDGAGGAFPTASVDATALAPDQMMAADVPAAAGLPAQALSAPFEFAAPAMAAPTDLPMDANMDASMDTAMADAMLYPHAPQTPQQRLSAYARLRFEDGSYYMHTYQIVLGRNVDLAHQDMRRLAKVEQLRNKGDERAAAALLHGKKRKRTTRGARSVISEAGGIVNAPIERMPMEYQQRRQSGASHSLSSSSHRKGGSQGSQEEPVEHAPHEMLMQTFAEVPDHLESQVPENPDDCPFVPIHPQHVTDRSGIKGPKGISREHAKIFFDFENGNFCLQVLGSNGLHHEGTFYKKNDVIELQHGDAISIGLVEMSFFLPDVALTEEQRKRQEPPSRPMSFSFENGQGELESDEHMGDDSLSEDVSINPRHVYHYPVNSELESEDDMLADAEDLHEDELPSTPEKRPKQSLKLKLKTKGSLPLSKKELKKAHKRKQVREPSPEEQPLPKKQKPKVKEKEMPPETPKEKGKAPAKAPSKAPAKAPAKSPVKSPVKEAKPVEKPEPAKDIKSESPTLVRKSNAEIQESPDDGATDGLITAAMVEQFNLPRSLIGMPLEKRKGPGRPPKDGVMSKRQRSQLVKQGKELEKARAAGIDPAELPTPTMKPKIARARKDSNSNPMEGDEDDIRETTEKGEPASTSGEKKQTKPSKPPRTPSPEMRIEDYTEEQLQRPSANYVVLIHEAISSSPTGQMNLQQIYNYIERNYPWYKFKTTTSGWQSSVRHNLGQHDAFVKGDKEGKGFNWRINPDVSIEKERRKRQVSPVQVGGPRQQYYPPPPNGYPPTPYGGQPGHPGFYPPMPPVPPNATPRPPPSLETVQPRLPPSLARSAGTGAAPAPQSGPSHTPYASPWAGNNTAGSPAHNPRPYPPPNSQTPPISSAGASSGQYGVLLPTSAPQGPYNAYTTAGGYGSQYATAGASPYGAPGQKYSPYPTPGPPANGAPALPPGQAPHGVPQNHTQGHPQTQNTPNLQAQSASKHPSGRYPPNTNPDLIRQLEAFRTVYLQTRVEPGEDTKCDNAIRAYVIPRFSASLSAAEKDLLTAISGIPTLKELPNGGRMISEETTTEGQQQATGAQVNGHQQALPTAAASTAAAIAADAAAKTGPNNGTVAPTQAPSVGQQPQANETASEQPGPPVSAPPAMAPTQPSEPHKFTPNMTGATAAAPTPAHIQAQRPSVEPLTPVPGSPAVQNQIGTPVKRSFTEISATADTEAGASEAKIKAETEGEGNNPAQ